MPAPPTTTKRMMTGVYIAYAIVAWCYLGVGFSGYAAFGQPAPPLLSVPHGPWYPLALLIGTFRQLGSTSAGSGLIRYIVAGSCFQSVSATNHCAGRRPSWAVLSSQHGMGGRSGHHPVWRLTQDIKASSSTYCDMCEGCEKFAGNNVGDNVLLTPAFKGTVPVGLLIAADMMVSHPQSMLYWRTTA